MILTGFECLVQEEIMPAVPFEEQSQKAIRLSAYSEIILLLIKASSLEIIVSFKFLLRANSSASLSTPGAPPLTISVQSSGSS